MIETASEALYSVIGLTALFGILLMLCKDMIQTYKHHNLTDNIAMLFIALAMIELTVMLIVKVVIYMMG